MGGKFKMFTVLCLYKAYLLGIKIKISVNYIHKSVLRIRTRNPESGTFLTPGSGMGNKSGFGSGIRMRDEQPGSYVRELINHILGVKMLKFFDADPGSVMEKIRIR
jgi:hypothetical protein